MRSKENMNKEIITQFQKNFNRMIKIISSHWFLLTMATIWIASFYVILTLIYMIFGFQCTLDTYFYMSGLHLIYLLAVFGLEFILISIDFILNVPLIIKCRFKQILWDEDPFHYRLELIGMIFLFPPTIIWFFGDIPQYFDSVVAEYSVFIGLWIAGLQVLLITIVKTIYYFFRGLKKKSNDKEVLMINDMIDDDVLDPFIEFCESEWSTENILAKLDIVEYRNLKSDKEREILCKTMKERYLIVNKSPLELNCQSNALNKVVERIDAGNFDDNLFDGLETNIDLNLSDTISRFQFSSMYYAFLKDKTEENDALSFSRSSKKLTK
eukprot:gene9438-1644_t